MHRSNKSNKNFLSSGNNLCLASTLLSNLQINQKNNDKRNKGSVVVNITTDIHASIWGVLQFLTILRYNKIKSD